MGAEMTMIADLLTSSPGQANAVLDDVSWRWVWTDTSGEALIRIVDQVGPGYWKTKSLAQKKAEIQYLSGGRTGDISQRAIVMILGTCASSAQVRAIDKSVGWPGLDWDLTGGYQDQFDRLKR
jgi:hypothetical protein